MKRLHRYSGRRLAAGLMLGSIAGLMGLPAHADDILFTSNREGGVFQLFRMAPDGTGARRATAEQMEATQIDLSADQLKAVFVSVRKGQPDLQVVDLPSGRVTQLTHNAAMEGSPAWSPDGRTVVFQSYSSGAPRLYIVNADGSGVRKLTDGEGEESAPTFSPDGTKVAYVVTVSRREAQIRVSDVATGKTTILGANPMIGAENTPRWSPDGQRLAYVMLKDDATHIHTVRADGTSRTALTQGKGKNNEPQWSPDGRSIVFVSVRAPSSRQAIYTMAADGSELREVIGGPEEHMSARYSPDGKRLYFVRFHRGGGQIFTAQTDGSQERRISSGEGYDAELLLAAPQRVGLVATR